MTKKTFLNKLKSKLKTLNENEIETILKKYEKIIEEEIKNGKKEADIIKALGDIDLIAMLYLKPNKEATKNRMPNNFVDSIIEWVDDVIKKIDGPLAKQILLMLCLIFIGMAGLILFQLPFKMIIALGHVVFRLIFADYFFYRFVILAWSYILNICYLFLVIWLMVKYINKIVEHQSNKKNSKNSNDKAVDKEKDAKNNLLESGFDILYVILKIFVILLAIPLVIFSIILFISLVIGISLVIYGVTIFGPLLLVIGLLLMIMLILNLIFKLVLKGGLK